MIFLSLALYTIEVCKPQVEPIVTIKEKTISGGVSKLRKHREGKEDKEYKEGESKWIEQLRKKLCLVTNSERRIQLWQELEK